MAGTVPMTVSENPQVRQTASATAFAQLDAHNQSNSQTESLPCRACTTNNLGCRKRVLEADAPDANRLTLSSAPWPGGRRDPVGYAELNARGIDYTGTSVATAKEDGQFEIDVRPNSELQLVAVSDDESSDAMTISSGDANMSSERCLVVLGERGLSDSPIQIEGETGTVDICVRDHECEDGDAIGVDVEGRNIFTGELVNDAMCSVLEVEAGRDYVIELTALNGTGFKGACNFADANTGEIRVSGLNVETQIWRHREGAGSQARIVVTTGIPQPFTIMPTPPDATVRFWE